MWTQCHYTPIQILKLVGTLVYKHLCAEIVSNYFLPSQVFSWKIRFPETENATLLGSPADSGRFPTSLAWKFGKPADKTTARR